MSTDTKNRPKGVFVPSSSPQPPRPTTWPRGKIYKPNGETCRLKPTTWRLYCREPNGEFGVTYVTDQIWLSDTIRVTPNRPAPYHADFWDTAINNWTPVGNCAVANAIARVKTGRRLHEH